MIRTTLALLAVLSFGLNANAQGRGGAGGGGFRGFASMNGGGNSFASAANASGTSASTGAGGQMCAGGSGNSATTTSLAGTGTTSTSTLTGVSGITNTGIYNTTATTALATGMNPYAFNAYGSNSNGFATNAMYANNAAMNPYLMNMNNNATTNTNSNSLAASADTSAQTVWNPYSGYYSTGTSKAKKAKSLKTKAKSTTSTATASVSMCGCLVGEVVIRYGPALYRERALGRRCYRYWQMAWQRFEALRPIARWQSPDIIEEDPRRAIPISVVMLAGSSLILFNLSRQFASHNVQTTSLSFCADFGRFLVRCGCFDRECCLFVFAGGNPSSGCGASLIGSEET